MFARIGLDASVPKRRIASNCLEEKGFSRLECRFQRIPEGFFGLERVRSQCCVMAEGRGLEPTVGIPSNTNGYSLQPTWAQSRMPMDRIVSGACVSFFHASHAASTMAS